MKTEITPPYRSIASKFRWLIIPVMALAAICILLLYASLKYHAAQQELTEKVELISRLHSLAVAEPLWTLNLDGLDRSLRTIDIHPEIICAEVLEADNASRYLWPLECHLTTDPQQVHNSALQFHDQSVGQLNLYYTDKPLLDDLLQEVVIGAVFILVLVGLAAFIASEGLKRIVGVPLSHLMYSIRNVDQNDNHQLVAWQSNDEMGSVINAYNDMVRRADEHTAELVEARISAEQAADTKTRFLANMSHELRTPLNAVIGITEMLREEAEDKQEDTEPHERVAAAGRHLLGLIDNILDLSKIEADKIELAPEPVDLPDLLESVVGTSRPLANRRKNTLHLNLGKIPDQMILDPVRVRQILINLIGNACKFTQQGDVTVSAEEDESAPARAVIISVSDTGIGIDQSKLEKLFTDFSQGDESTTREYGGTGLGLAISQRLCQLMGSEIRVNSEPGKGSEFSFTLHELTRVERPQEYAGDLDQAHS